MRSTTSSSVCVALLLLIAIPVPALHASAVPVRNALHHTVFGLDVDKLLAKEAGNDDAVIEELVAQRTEARKNKDWAKSDELRDQLKEMGVVLKDTPQGTRWSRE